jgi:hypothetical protein
MTALPLTDNEVSNRHTTLVVKKDVSQKPTDILKPKPHIY